MAKLSALLAAKNKAKKLREKQQQQLAVESNINSASARSTPGTGTTTPKGRRETVGAGAETHLTRTSKTGSVAKAVRRVEAQGEVSDDGIDVVEGVAGQSPFHSSRQNASFTVGVRAALSGLLSNNLFNDSASHSWNASQNRNSNGTARGYDDSVSTAQLVAAVLEDNAEDVEAAIEAGAHINGRLSGETDADSGQTAIIKAVRLGCLEVLDLLLQKGADPYVKDDLHRDAWYYACFGINIKDGDHQTLMSLMLMYWELEQDVLLLAMHSPHPGVRREALNALDMEVVSRDAKNDCIIRFNDLGMIDCKECCVIFPDGSRSQPGLSPLTKMIQQEAMESVSHPSVMAVILWKWKAFGRMCLFFDLMFYVAALVCTSGWAIRYRDTSQIYMVDFTNRGDAPLAPEHRDSLLEGFRTASLVTSVLMLWEETMLVTSVCIKTSSFAPIFGRFLHSFSAVVPVIVAYSLHGRGMYAESAQVMAFAVIIIWLRVLYFAKFTRGFGAFCITLIEMIRRDVLKCLLILLLVLPGFVIAISLLVQTHCAEFLDEEEVERWAEMGKSTTSLIFMLLGTTAWYDAHPCLDQPVANISTVLFLVITMIVLLNLLIAMFADTYERIQGMAVHTWALNLAEYIMQKEIWMGVIGYSSRRVLMAKSEHAEAYEVRGQYQDYFLPALRIDNGDERVEDFILAQLQELAEVSKIRYEEMSGRMKRIERSFMADKIKTAAASALKGALGGGGGGGGLKGGFGKLAAGAKNLETISEPSVAAPSTGPMSANKALQRMAVGSNPRASMDIMSRNKWAVYEADSQDAQRIQKQARPGRKSTAVERRKSMGARAKSNSSDRKSFGGQLARTKGESMERTASQKKEFTEQLQRGLHEPAVVSRKNTECNNLDCNRRLSIEVEGEETETSPLTQPGHVGEDGDGGGTGVEASPSRPRSVRFIDPDELLDDPNERLNGEEAETSPLMMPGQVNSAEPAAGEDGDGGGTGGDVAEPSAIGSVH